MLNSPATADTAKLVGRVLLALIFVLSGWSKISGYAGTQQYMASVGVPGFLLPLVILTELGGGLLIIVGYQTRLVALALAGFTLLAAVLFHYHPADEMEMINFMKNISITGGFLVLFASGPGAYALDARRG